MTDLNVDLSYYPDLDGVVTEDDLTSFLTSQQPENQVLDYKKNLDAGKLTPTIAGYANRYGGYLVVGVPEVKDPDGSTVPGAPEPLPMDADERLRRMCRDDLDPPFIVDIAPVPLTGGGLVLVVRIPPIPQLRPVLAKRQIWVRDGDQTVVANRHETIGLCAAAGASMPSAVLAPESVARSSGFATGLDDPWFTFRGIAAAGPPVGVPLAVIGKAERADLVGSLSGSPVDAWVSSWTTKWDGTINAWAVSGETTSRLYDVSSVGLVDGIDHVRARLRFGIGDPTSPMAGVWCVADLSLLIPGATAETVEPYTFAVTAPPTGTRLGIDELGDNLTAALATAEHVVRRLADLFPQPRPTHARFAAGFIGAMSARIDLAAAGPFTQNVADRTRGGFAFTVPELRAELGAVDLSRASQEYIDRFLLDIGAT